MATLTITAAAGSSSGTTFRDLAKAIKAAAAELPDNHTSGPSAVLVIDTSPVTGVATVQLSGAGLPTQKKHQL